jgi:hypothetical protein
MINQYPEQWVAIYDGEVKAHGDNYNSVLAQVDSQRIPRSLTLVRYIAKKRKSMIL